MEWLIALDEFIERDDALLVSLDLLVEMVCLEHGQDFDNGPLEASTSHQAFVVVGGKSLFKDLDSLDGLHPVLDHIDTSLLCHELSTFFLICCIFHALFSVKFKDDDISYLREFNLVQDLKRDVSCVEVVVEVMNIIRCQPVQFSDLKQVGNRSLNCYLIGVVVLHNEDMHDIDDEKNHDLPILDVLTLQEETHDNEVTHEEKAVSGGDPPVDTGVLIGQGVEVTLDDQSIQS